MTDFIREQKRHELWPQCSHCCLLLLIPLPKNSLQKSKYGILHQTMGDKSLPQSSLLSHLFWAQMLSKNYGQNAESSHEHHSSYTLKQTNKRLSFYVSRWNLTHNSFTKYLTRFGNLRSQRVLRLAKTQDYIRYKIDRFFLGFKIASTWVFGSKNLSNLQSGQSSESTLTTHSRVFPSLLHIPYADNCTSLPALTSGNNKLYWGVILSKVLRTTKSKNIICGFHKF